jgi:hypothetical protein
MFTIFTIPKPFIGHNGVIQRNAIGSWLKLHPAREIILFGDEVGVAEIAQSFNLKNIFTIEKNKYGTPLLHHVFDNAQDVAKHDTLIFCNTDVILIDDLIGAVDKLPKTEFLACGRRWDVNITSPIDYSDTQWMDKIIELKRSSGILHGFAGLDYFIFKKNTIEMRPFAVGRPGWDNWLIYYARSRGIPVIDTTSAITAIHQNHDYSHSQFGLKKKVVGPEQNMNVKIAGGLINMMTLREANFLMDGQSIKPPQFPRRIYPILSSLLIWRILLSVRRKILLKVDSLK